jgi:hypothetical protein
MFASHRRILPSWSDRQNELIGQLTDDVLPSEAAHSVKVAIEQALRTGQTANVEYALEINQKAFWFEGTDFKTQ